MKFTSICLLVVLAICVKGNHVSDSESEREMMSKGDVSGSVREGWQRLKEMTEDLMEDKRKTKKTTTTTTTTTTTDPETLSISDLVQRNGYPFEEHEVTTPDGYVIVMHRIPHGKDMVSNAQRIPVFLQHGLLSSSDSWLLNEPELSLPYLLSNAGYDVWMGNTRGNIYGRKHLTMKPEQPEFWNFSWDDIARHDLPTMINYIVKLTDVPIQYVNPHTVTDELKTVDTENLNTLFGGQSRGNTVLNPTGKLHYIGHSEGTLLGFVQFGRDKELANLVTVFVAMSPIATIGSGQTPLTQLLKNYDVSNIETPEVLTNTQLKNLITQVCDENEDMDDLCGRILVELVNPTTENTNNVMTHPQILKRVVDICEQEGSLDEKCKKLLMTLITNPLENIELSRVPLYLSRLPAGTSRKNLVHYSQLAKTGKLQGFDYGLPELNKKLYGEVVPPQYSLKDVNVPVALFYGKHDWIVSEKDLENIKQNLPNILHQELLDTFGHFDFVLAKNAKERVYNKLVQLLSQNQNQ